jgi:circadian clock protein KaiB
VKGAAPGAARLTLRLYVAGSSPNSKLALDNATAFLLEHFPARYDLEVVDMLLEPERALADGIVVTPTLLKLSPLPACRLIGNLDDGRHLLASLSIR